jgi:hypothetical protein
LVVPDIHGPETPGSPRRARRVALALAAVALVMAAGGAISFRRFVAHTKSDPGFAYRDHATFEKVLKRARDAERHGDRATAITNYRFLLAVGAHGDSALESYVAAARDGLARLTPATSDTPPGLRR